MARVLAQGDHRPMSDSSEAMRDLERILAGRESMYAKAEAVLDTTGSSIDASLSALLALLPE
jgi:XRE family aerobic/anaerobic benzoate catabolism transcriptional regulator